VKVQLFILLFCLMTSSSFAETLKGSCRVEFRGTTTLKDFSGRADCSPFTLSISSRGNSGPIFESSEISVPVASMDSANKKRDKKMRAMLESKKFPLITGQSAELTANKIQKLAAMSSNERGEFEFTLKIRNIALAQKVQVSNLQENDKQITFDLAFDLSLNRYQLNPPGFLGLIRVGDQVQLKISVLLLKENPGRVIPPNGASL